ncbi:hydantoinase/oxoprolinase family protein [Aquibaculum arenosum]|uniref:Hydantoinase/oxoprolinase family protein n=1 Tax=Aquibaculum arenosum TaxID=3032591 RepID=A0ABT5YM18_9PROT|nr:hydantoinase/oxoprolinase family protein [Fodinicurvata sp. CAU 1616]MDF2096002.1 hydantoinase/oxoprolinase family protein [Fodinicurvata sp. CAU 1616]
MADGIKQASDAGSGWIVGVDVGGTFTDFYGFDRATGTIQLHKTPSTPDNPAKAIVSGLRDMGASKALPLSAVTNLAHGTTVATNALIQRKGGTVAVITTRGFRDLLEIGRQVRPRMYDLKADYPAPLAKREHRFEITERVGPEGQIITPLDETELEEIAQALTAIKAEACAVCLLFSYINPAHEERIGTWLRERLPTLAVSLSSEVQPEFREYERFSTALLNTYLQPIFAGYMSHLEQELAELTPKARVGINQSSGGLMSIARARSFPIRTALSGPAAGVMAAIHTARQSQRPNVITLDMGGTSADVALIRNCEAGLAFDREVAGFPVRLPMVDINTVGAGGGSIAWFERDGLLKVGPLSAGADPGPACYRRGGDQLTVTDANVVLGRLSARGLLGGSMSLDVAASRAVTAPIAERLGFSIEKTAQGVLGIVTANMVRAIRAISVERGHDPRQFTLMPFGGAGPLHANAVARALGIHEILVPLAPGILCAQGLVVADIKEDLVRSRRLPVVDDSLPELQTLLEELAAEAQPWFEQEEIPVEARLLQVSLDMRYEGQNFELRVPVDVDVAAPRLPEAKALRQLFFEEHESSYGFFNPEDPVEVINLRLTALGALPPPRAPSAPEGASLHPEPVERRPVWFDEADSHDTPVYRREALAPGCIIPGPAVIDQFDATTLVYPGDTARVDDALNLMIEIAP